MKKNMLLFALITISWCACSDSEHSVVNSVQPEMNSTALVFQIFNE